MKCWQHHQWTWWGDKWPCDVFKEWKCWCFGFILWRWGIFNNRTHWMSFWGSRQIYLKPSYWGVILRVLWHYNYGNIHVYSCMIFLQQNMQEYTHLHMLHCRYLHVNSLFNMTPWLKRFTQLNNTRCQSFITCFTSWYIPTVFKPSSYVSLNKPEE